MGRRLTWNLEKGEDELDESKKQYDLDVERIANLEQLKNELQTEVVCYTS